MDSMKNDYSKWPPEQLIRRVAELEKQLREQNEKYSSSKPPSPTPPWPKRKALPKAFDPTKYSTRLVAFKFAYLGAGYNGFEHHTGNATPLPTIEEELWKALVKCRLIFPPSLKENGLDVRTDVLDEIPVGQVPVDWTECYYSKCGRTDKGVSAFGQVVGLRVRSAKPLEISKKMESAVEGIDASINGSEQTLKQQHEADTELPTTIKEQDAHMEDEYDKFDSIKDELSYIPLLNKVLPPSIRILAWSPNPPPNFDARFSCKERKYRYFFTGPAFLPSPGASGNKEGWLDIEAMREAASYLVGNHDFRNFCKVDPTKQITNFTRRITSTDIKLIATNSSPTFVDHPAFTSSSSSIGDSGSKTALYAFEVQGSAFLWHQVRCMVAILFLIGQGLEQPSLVKQLLDVSTNPCRPKYDMASDKPLVLWECTFSASHATGKFAPGERPVDYVDRGTGRDELEWVYAGDETGSSSGKWGRNGVMEDLWKGWRKAKMDEVLAGQLMDLVALQGPSLENIAAGKINSENKVRGGGQRVFEGYDLAPPRGKYIPVMKKERMDAVDVINERWAARKTAAGKFTKKGDRGNE